MSVHPTPDQVLSLAPDKAAAAAALALAVPAVWSLAGCDDSAVWGQYIAASAEPYNVAVDLSDDVSGPAYRCSCPSRKIPCKHGLGLLLLHSNRGVARARRLPFATEWLQRRLSRPDAESDNGEATRHHGDVVATHDGDELADASDGALGGGSRSARPMPAADPARQKRQFERAERMRAGLQELDRWLADRIRVGLANAELSDPATWERLAARLVDAQCGALANRVKRVATKVGSHPRWHDDVLEEMALLHALALGAQRTGNLPGHLGDGVHAATGLTVAKDDVLASVPTTGHWFVAAESRTREDRITVQRTWLAAQTSSSGDATTWAMVLSFGAFGNEVTAEYEVGTTIEADVHWYPGGINLRALVGRVHGPPAPTRFSPRSTMIAEALTAAGWAVAGEPWLERYPVWVVATPTPLGNGRWCLVDGSGAVPIAGTFARMAEVVSVSAGYPVELIGEWSIDGFLPLTVISHGRTVIL